MDDDIDVGALRAKAEAATKSGPWFVDEARGLFIRPADMSAPTICDITEQGDPVEPGCYGTEYDNAHFIAAAQPRVVIALLDRLEAAESGIAGCLASMEDMRAENARLRTLLAKVGEAIRRRPDMTWLLSLRRNERRRQQ